MHCTNRHVTFAQQKKRKGKEIASVCRKPLLQSNPRHPQHRRAATSSSSRSWATGKPSPSHLGGELSPLVLVSPVGELARTRHVVSFARPLNERSVATQASSCIHNIGRVIQIHSHPSHAAATASAETSSASTAHASQAKDQTPKPLQRRQPSLRYSVKYNRPLQIPPVAINRSLVRSLCFPAMSQDLPALRVELDMTPRTPCTRTEHS